MSFCRKCRQPIRGASVQALGQQWHPACFRCHYCKKSITETTFTTFSGNPYHKDCLKCPSCKKSITSEYVEHDGLPWHAQCYQAQNSPKCSVCRKPLAKHYLVDFWGNAFCNTHTHYSNCSSCGRIVCENLTDGGMQYPDGVVICNICNLCAVDTQERAERLLDEMRRNLASVGLKLNSSQTPLTLCGRDELRKASRHNFHNERPILGLARWTITTSGGKVVARTFKDILIQRNLPEEHFRTIAIHELTHAWFFYNNYQDLPLVLEEGMCVLMEYIWLKNQDTQDAKYRRTLIEQSDDPIYGKGFHQAREAIERLPLLVLMQYIKEKKAFPSKLAAFFYH